MNNFLDYNGLSHYDDKIKRHINNSLIKDYNELENKPIYLNPNTIISLFEQTTYITGKPSGTCIHLGSGTTYKNIINIGNILGTADDGQTFPIDIPQSYEGYDYTIKGVKFGHLSIINKEYGYNDERAWKYYGNPSYILNFYREYYGYSEEQYDINSDDIDFIDNGLSYLVLIERDDQWYSADDFYIWINDTTIDSSISYNFSFDIYYNEYEPAIESNYKKLFKNLKYLEFDHNLNQLYCWQTGTTPNKKIYTTTLYVSTNTTLYTGYEYSPSYGEITDSFDESSSEITSVIDDYSFVVDNFFTYYRLDDSNDIIFNENKKLLIATVTDENNSITNEFRLIFNGGSGGAEYEAGTGIDITEDVISVESPSVELTQEEYDALETKDPDTIYYITDSDKVGVNIEDLNNTNISNPNNNQVLSYNNGQWINSENLSEKSVNQNWQDNGYNLIPYPYHDGMSKTYNGITYTVNSDGSITANGTSTGNATFVLIDPIVLSSGKYRLLGCPQNGGATKYEIQLTDGTIAYRDYGNGVEIENAGLSYHIILVIREGFVANNLTFKPMLVKVSDNGSYPTEYQRYAMGNVELTDKFNGVYIGQGSSYLAPGKTYILRDIPYNVIDSRFFKVIISANQSYGDEVFAYEYFGVVNYTPYEGTNYRGVTIKMVSNVGKNPDPAIFSVEFGYDEGGVYVLNNGIITAYMTVIAKKEDLLI